MSQNIIGVEINEEMIRIANAKFQNGVVFVQSLGTAATAPNFFGNIDTEVAQQKQAQNINKLFSDLKLAPGIAHVVIPDSQTFAQVLETPLLAEKDLVSAIRYQADEFIPMPLEDVYLDLEILQQNPQSGKLSILIVAASKKMVDGVYNTIELSGLTPKKLETEVSAICRLVSSVMKSRSVKSGYCILNLGVTSSSVYVMDNSQGVLVFVRSCRVGLDLITRELMANQNLSREAAQNLLLDPGESIQQVQNSIKTSVKELGSEIDRIIDVYVHRFGMPISSIFTLNNASHIKSFDTLLGQHTATAVEPLPLNTIYVPNPVIKAFSRDITAFSSVVSAIL